MVLLLDYQFVFCLSRENLLNILLGTNLEKCMKILALTFAALCMTACASVQPLGSGMALSLGNCYVKVFCSLESAKAGGDIEELCMISGTSSGSFSHTVATAVQKHKDKACDCGADNVYIQAQDAGTLGTASVTLIGFRYKKPSQ
jgi:hypothetical protein